MCEWAQGRTRQPTTHTLVKLTLCNACYLIIENGKGRNQVSLWWRRKGVEVVLSGSSSLSARLLLVEEAVVVFRSALFMLSWLVPRRERPRSW